MFWGKILGGFLGYLVAGPLGLVFGLIVGHYFDRGFGSILLSGGFGAFDPNRTNQARATFFDVTFLVMGHVAKADGRVSEQEIQIAERIMRRMMLRAEQKKQAMYLFTQGKQPEFDLTLTLNNLKQACRNQRMLLQMFLEIQLQVASANGHIAHKKRQVLETICQNLGFSSPFIHQADEAFDPFQQQNQQRQNYQRSERNHSRQWYYDKDSIKDPYSILGIAKNSPFTEVKKAYRKLMNQHHPDKLVSKGLPEEMMKLATEKAQEIQKAYDSICKEHGQ